MKKLKRWAWLRNILHRVFPKNRLPDDNIERHEPDTILPVFLDFLFGMIMTAVLAMGAYAFMNGGMAEWIAHFIAAQPNPLGYGFEDRFAAFTSSVIILAEMVTIFAIALSRKPDNEDVVEVINDLADELNERFAEFENRTANEIDQVRKMVDDLTPEDAAAIERRMQSIAGD